GCGRASAWPRSGGRWSTTTARRSRPCAVPSPRGLRPRTPAPPGLRAEERRGDASGNRCDPRRAPTGLSPGTGVRYRVRRMLAPPRDFTSDLIAAGNRYLAVLGPAIDA